jgi:hypothetical protein
MLNESFLKTDFYCCIRKNNALQTTEKKVVSYKYDVFSGAQASYEKMLEGTSLPILLF